MQCNLYNYIPHKKEVITFEKKNKYATLKKTNITKSPPKMFRPEQEKKNIWELFKLRGSKKKLFPYIPQKENTFFILIS